MISVSWHLFCDWLEILLGLSSRENLQRFFFNRLHRYEKCNASTGLHSICCFSHLFQSARLGCMHENFFCVNASSAAVLLGYSN